MSDRINLVSRHIVVINRWRERYAEYARYIDHAANRVTYISTEVGLGSVPPEAMETVLVEATDDLEAVRSALRELADRHGAPWGIIALKEDDLIVGATLREEWGVPGQRREDLIRFRDKYVMCGAIAEAGLPVPAFVQVTGARAIFDLADEVGWPLVFKPRMGSSSAGVVLLTGPADVAALSFAGEPALVQAYDPHPIYHVDGIFTGREMARWRASRYTSTCLGFRDGNFLGSVEEDHPQVLAAIGAAATRFLAALTTKPTPFHLELFVDATDPDRVGCTFLEVGARVGGAEIPFIWRELHGYDLMAAAVRLQLGLPADEPAAAGGGPATVDQPATERAEVGGWLLIPAPTERPCLITEVTPMVGRQPGPYTEALLQPGEILPAADSYYEHVGGRFRFRGASRGAVEAALIATATNFRVSAEPIAVDDSTQLVTQQHSALPRVSG